MLEYDVSRLSVELSEGSFTSLSDAISRVFQEYFKSTSRVFQEYFKSISRVFQEYFKSISTLTDVKLLEM